MIMCVVCCKCLTNNEMKCILFCFVVKAEVGTETDKVRWLPMHKPLRDVGLDLGKEEEEEAEERRRRLIIGVQGNDNDDCSVASNTCAVL